jgi:hypothetical protein
VRSAGSGIFGAAFRVLERLFLRVLRGLRVRIQFFSCGLGKRFLEEVLKDVGKGVFGRTRRRPFFCDLRGGLFRGGACPSKSLKAFCKGFFGVFAAHFLKMALVITNETRGAINVKTA